MKRETKHRLFMVKCSIAAAVLLALVAVSPLFAQMNGGLQFPGPGTAHSAGASYTGPGDIQASATVWYGLRAYSAATRGNAFANVCNSTAGIDVGCADMVTDASTGAPVSATISGITCPGANCTIKTLYDQSGNAVHVTQATVADRPTLDASVIGSLPGAKCNGGNVILRSSGVPSTLTEPFTMSAVAERTAVVSFAGLISGNLVELAFANSANNLLMYNGNSIATRAANDSIPHAIQAVFNNAVGTAYTSTDNVAASNSVTMNLGASVNFDTIVALCAFANAGSQPFTGYVFEAGVWPGDQTATRATMDTNQRAFWGF